MCFSRNRACRSASVSARFALLATVHDSRSVMLVTKASQPKLACHRVFAPLLAGHDGHSQQSSRASQTHRRVEIALAEPVFDPERQISRKFFWCPNDCRYGMISSQMARANLLPPSVVLLQDIMGCRRTLPSAGRARRQEPAAYPFCHR